MFANHLWAISTAWRALQQDTAAFLHVGQKRLPLARAVPSTSSNSWTTELRILGTARSLKAEAGFHARLPPKKLQQRIPPAQSASCYPSENICPARCAGRSTNQCHGAAAWIASIMIARSFPSAPPGKKDLLDTTSAEPVTCIDTASVFSSREFCILHIAACEACTMRSGCGPNNT